MAHKCTVTVERLLSRPFWTVVDLLNMCYMHFQCPFRSCMLPMAYFYFNNITIILYFSYPRLLETSLTYKPRVSVSYKREDTNLLVSGNLGMLLSSKYPLRQVEDIETIRKTEEIPLEKPEIISPVFNLNKAKTTWKLDTGFYNGAPFPYPHTLIIVSTNQKWTTSDLVAQGKVQRASQRWTIVSM